MAWRFFLAGFWFGILERCQTLRLDLRNLSTENFETGVITKGIILNKLGFV